MSQTGHRAPVRAAASQLLPLSAVAVAAAVFVLDTITHTGVAVATLYVAVVLIASRFCRLRGLMLVAGGCAALTMFSYLLSRGPEEEGIVAGVNDLLALSAIALTTVLLARYQAAHARALAAAQALQDQLRLVVDTIPALVWSKLPDGSVDFLNQRFREYSGLSLDEGAGWGWLKTIHPEDRPGFEAQWRAAMAKGTASAMEARLRRADGEYHWFLNLCAPLRDERGKIVKWYATNFDIEDRKRAEVALREQAGLLDLSHDAIFVRDANDVLTYWNRGAEERYGWSREEALGRISHELTQTIFPAPLEDITAELLRAGHWEGELVHTRRDGTRVSVASRWSLLRDGQGRPVAILETNNDITERKLALAEQAYLEQRLREAEKLEALGTLASGIAHDFNNILGAILGYGDMAHRVAAEGSDLRRHTAAVLTAGQRGKALVDQILDYSRSQRGPRNPVDVRDVVDETLDLLRASLPADIQLEVHSDAEPLVVICNATQVHQIMMNLCTNAVHAMPDGGTLRVTRRRRDAAVGRTLSHGTLLAGSYVELAVSDTGSGMPPGLLKRVFEPFFTTKEPGAGTGLGLALVQSIVSELGGAIDLESAPGQGSTFRICLPRLDVPAAGVFSDLSLKRGSGQRVIVVDDERSLLLLFEEMLATLGYEPVGFSVAHEAVEAVASDGSQFDAALIDYLLPGTTGIELTRRLREHRPHLPVIVLSGYRGPMLEQEAKAAGIARVLTKPIRIDTLGEALAATVR